MMYDPGEEAERILGELERVVVSVLDEAGLDPNWPKGPTRPRAPQGLGESAAVYVYREIQSTRADVAAGRHDWALCRALQLMYRFMEARFELTKGLKLKSLMEAEERREDPLRKANADRKARTSPIWDPWIRDFRRRVDSGVKKSQAIDQIGDAMTDAGFFNPKTGEVYSRTTLWKRLNKST